MRCVRAVDVRCVWAFGDAFGCDGALMAACRSLVALRLDASHACIVIGFVIWVFIGLVVRPIAAWCLSGTCTVACVVWCC